MFGLWSTVGWIALTLSYLSNVENCPRSRGLSQQQSVFGAQSQPCQSWRLAGHPKKEKRRETRKKSRKKSQRKRKRRSQLKSQQKRRSNRRGREGEGEGTSRREGATRGGREGGRRGGWATSVRGAREQEVAGRGGEGVALYLKSDLFISRNETVRPRSRTSYIDVSGSD